MYKTVSFLYVSVLRNKICAAKETRKLFFAPQSQYRSYDLKNPPYYISHVISCHVIGVIF